MAQQKIYLSKVRDFGENLGDTFQFIRQEFKPLFRSFALISGIFLLGAAILNGLYQMRMRSAFDRIETKPGDFSFIGDLFNSTYFLFILMTLVGVVAMQLTIACYMKLYDRENASPTVEQVWAEFKKHFGSALLLVFVMAILLAIGAVLCLLPGVYLWVVFSPAIMIMVNEETSFSDTFSRCFELVKENFWMSLGIYLVAFLIYTFAAGAIGLVLGVITGVSSYLTTKDVKTTMAWVTSLSNIFSYCFYIVFFVSVCLNYFTLAVKRDGFGMMKRLETLGTTNPNDRTEEQY
jgi:hypothetical protein